MTATARGRFGEFGGTYAPETLMPALLTLERDWERLRAGAG